MLTHIGGISLRHKVSKIINWSILRTKGAKLHDMRSLYYNLLSNKAWQHLSHDTKKMIDEAINSEHNIELALNKHEDLVRELGKQLSEELKTIRDQLGVR